MSLWLWLFMEGLWLKCSAFLISGLANTLRTPAKRAQSVDTGNRR